MRFKKNNKKSGSDEKSKEAMTAVKDVPVKESEENPILSSARTSLYGLQKIKTSFRGYSKKDTKKYLQGILDEQARQEEAMNRLVEGLQNQIAGLKRDKDESIRKYNELLIEKKKLEDQNSSEDESETLKEKITELVGEISNLQAEKEESLAERKKLAAEIKVLEEKSTNPCNEHPEDTADERISESQMAELKEKLEKAEISNKKLLETLNASEKNLVSLRGENHTMELSLTQARQDLKQKDEALSEIIAAKNEAVIALKKQDAAMKDKARVIEEVSMREKALKKALAENKEKNIVTEQEKKAAISKIRMLTLKIDILTKKREELSSSLIQAKSSLQDTEEYASRLEAELNSIYDFHLAKQTDQEIPECDLEEKIAERSAPLTQ